MGEGDRMWKMKPYRELGLVRLTMRLKDTVKYKHTSGVIRVYAMSPILPICFLLNIIVR
jgi:hypothetical protein